MEQIKCPNCGGYNTFSISGKSRAMIKGMILIIFGGFVAIFASKVFGVPLMLIGAVVIFLGITKKDTGRMFCNKCGFKFIDEKRAKNAEDGTDNFWKFILK